MVVGNNAVNATERLPGVLGAHLYLLWLEFTHLPTCPLTSSLTVIDRQEAVLSALLTVSLLTVSLDVPTLLELSNEQAIRGRS